MSEYLGYCEHRISSRNTCPECTVKLCERIAALEAVIQYHPGGDCMSYTELAEEYGKLIKVAEAGIAIWEATPEEVDRYLKEQGDE